MVLLLDAVALLGGLLAAAGLLGQQITGGAIYQAIASGSIGIIPLVTSVVLLHTNRELLSGRGVGPIQTERMRQVVAGCPGVVSGPDIFGIVVGPVSVIVDADVIFDDGLNVPAVESIIVEAAAALRLLWPTISYIYLNPVAAQRPRKRR